LRLKSPLFSSFVAAGTIGVGEVKVNADDFVVLELVSVLYISVQGSKSILGNNKTNREFKIKKIGLTSYCYFLLLLFHHLRTLVVQIPQMHLIPPAHRYQSLRRGLGPSGHGGCSAAPSVGGCSCCRSKNPGTNGGDVWSCSCSTPMG
jgi:hypothetical protein